MSSAISAHGTIIARSPSGGPFVDIGELRNITPPPLTRNPIDTTSQNQLDDSYVVGVRRKGDFTFTIGFVPGLASHDHLTGLNKSWIDGSRDIWRITYPDNAQWLFSGYVTNVGPSAPVDDGLVADVTVRPTDIMENVAAS